MAIIHKNVSYIPIAKIAVGMLTMWRNRLTGYYTQQLVVSKTARLNALKPLSECLNNILAMPKTVSKSIMTIMPIFRDWCVIWNL